MPPFTVLHVCMGNICRSPMAERLLALAVRERLARSGAGVDPETLLHSHSAGTGGWHAGEQIRVEIMGHYERIDWFEPFNYDTLNKGDHIIHTGGQYDSFLQVPVIPPKYTAGTYKYY